MTEAALFYEAANAGLGDDFLDDIQHAIDTIREHPELGPTVASGFRRMLGSPLSFQHHLRSRAGAGGRRGSGSPATEARVLEGANMTANNALQPNKIHHGRPALAMNCLLAGAEWAWCPSAELGR